MTIFEIFLGNFFQSFGETLMKFLSVSLNKLLKKKLKNFDENFGNFPGMTLAVFSKRKFIKKNSSKMVPKFGIIFQKFWKHI